MLSRGPPHAMLSPWLAHTQALTAYRAGPANSLGAIVVIGNEAGDLDSLVSALAMAAWQPFGGGALWVPVAPFARCDFRLRQDACLLFRHAGLTFDDADAPADLLHLDEADAATAKAWQAGAGLGVALVDHNVQAAEVASVFGERVVAIVDHHNDAGRALAPPLDDGLGAVVVGSAALRHIDPSAGSTCSMLTELMDDACSEPAEGLRQHSIELLVLMLAAIAVDTRGLDPKLLGQKFVAADVRACQKLFGALGASVPCVLPPVGRAGGSEARELVLEAISALRALELPVAARVGGAASIGALCETLLAARYDVRELTTLELLRWDCKEGVRGEGDGAMRVRIAAICETVPELLQRSDGAAGLEAAMRNACERNGGAVGVLFALTKEDEAQGGRKGLVAYVGGEAVDAPITALVCGLLDAIAGTPSLPSALSSNPLFKAQRIEQEGFGIQWEAVEGAPRLRVSSLRAAATRKTLLPAVLQLGLSL